MTNLRQVHPWPHFIVIDLTVLFPPSQNLKEVNGVTTLVYRRLLDTGDSMDLAISLDNMYLLWAYGTADGTPNGNDWTFGQHANVSILHT